MTAIRIDTAYIISLALESIFFGIFTVFTAITMWVLVKRSRHGNVNYPLALTLCIMYILAIAHLSVHIFRAIKAFVDSATVPDGAIAYYQNLSTPENIAKSSIYGIQTLVGDSFVIYRCYIVWGKSWRVIILPIILLVSVAISGSMSTYEMSQVRPGSKVFVPALVPWITSTFIMTLCTNVLCTGMIAFRIWQTHRAVQEYALQSLHSVMIVVIESGAIYSSALLSLLVLYLLGSNGQYPALDLVTPLIGITFSMIMVRVGLGASANGPPTTIGATPTPNRSQRSSELGKYRMQPLTVNVSHLEEGQFVGSFVDSAVLSEGSSTRDSFRQSKLDPV